MIVVGLDIASKTGVVVLEDGKTAFTGIVFYPKHKTDNRMSRWDKYATEIAAHCANADLVVAEAPIVRRGPATIPLVEMGAIIKLDLWRLAKDVVEVPPSTLKLFATGKGNAKKERMVEAVLDRWNFDADTDDEADAYALAQVGISLLSGKVPDSLQQVKLKYMDILPKTQPVKFSGDIFEFDKRTCIKL